MPRIARSLIPGLLLGALAGLFFGWIPFPPEARNSALPDLLQRYRDEYTVMIAAGYAVDRDLAGALERLSLLQVDDIPSYLEKTTARIIGTSAHDLGDIQLLVRLAHDLGRMTAVMAPFLVLDSGDA